MRERKFKVGDIVCTVVEYDRHGNKLFPIGSVGTIEQVDTGSDDMPYWVTYKGSHFWYDEDGITLASDEEMNLIKQKEFARKMIEKFATQMYSDTFFLYTLDEENRVINWNKVKKTEKEIIDFIMNDKGE